MSSTELVATIVGLMLGYAIISRWMGQQHAEPRPLAGGAPAGTYPPRASAEARADDLDTEWVRTNWPEILGVSPNASAEVIKTAYRLRAEQYRVEKTDGLGPEIRSLAARKTRELDVAYAWATGSRSRGA